MRNKFNTLANREPAAVLVAITYFLTILALALLNSCTTARHATTSSAAPTTTTTSHNWEHDARTRQQEPNRSRIR